jgi:7,8-dihydropterin-6-yl-methyl-4-(beta-D-ribofuranosyl)aminobenzene 5'-phosphate synthase
MTCERVSGDIVPDPTSVQAGPQEGDEVKLLTFRQDRHWADEEWNTRRPHPLGDIGSVGGLSILPLTDWYADDDRLVGEAGVSYLVEAGEHRILFDVGANASDQEPSPLLRNMKTLGVSLESIDAIVISHPHWDHVGGMKPMREKSFRLSPNDVDLTGRTVYVPSSLTHSSANVVVTEEPTVLFPGVATIGIIWRALCLHGVVAEQALAVVVRGKGVVLIVGCGHQGLTRILARSDQLFDEPLYGLFGGLHYPVTKSRTKHPSQQVVGTGKWPWQRITKKDVEQAIVQLDAAAPRLVGISAHDSCDWTVGRFREAFGDRYRDVVVGRTVAV